MLKEGSPGTEIASVLGIHPDTLYIRCYQEKGSVFSAYAQGVRSIGDHNIRAQQYREALGINERKGNIQLLLRLGESRLGQGKDVEVDKEKLRQAIVFEQEVRRRVDAALQQAGLVRPAVEDEKPLLDKGLGGETGSVQPKLGSEGSCCGETPMPSDPES